MKIKTKSIRAFLGSKNYEISRMFYKDLGFEEIIVSEKMSFFKLNEFGFYLQDYFVKEWIDNSMIFLEVESLENHLSYVKSLDLVDKYEDVRISGIECNDWGNEFFIHDPSGILWHIGEFK